MYQRAIDHSNSTEVAVVATQPGVPGGSGDLSGARDAVHRMVGRLANRVVAASSLVPNDPVLNIRDFGWTRPLRDHWMAIRAEAQSVDVRADDDGYTLWHGGRALDDHASACPVTCSVIAQIPALYRAQFTKFPAASHSPARQGASKALLTCHLGLCVPRDGDVRMRLGDRVLRWAEGETLVFDDSYPHQMWNDSSSARLLLSLQLRRPLRQPGQWVADQMFARGWWS